VGKTVICFLLAFGQLSVVIQYDRKGKVLSKNSDYVNKQKRKMVVRLVFSDLIVKISPRI